MPKISFHSSMSLQRTHAELRSLIPSIPKAELHLHIEGTLSPSLLLTLASRNNVSLPATHTSPEAVSAIYSNLTTINEFLDAYYNATKVLITKRDFHELALSYIRKCAEELGVVHLECFFDPQAHTKRGIPFDTVAGGILDGLSEGKSNHGVDYRLIMCIVREESPESAMEAVRMAASWNEEQIKALTDDRDEHWHHIISGIGLDGGEIGRPPTMWKAAFNLARTLGFKHFCAHGGHDGPADPYVTDLLYSLRIDRIDHGNSCIDDPTLVQQLVERRIPLTICPISEMKWNGITRKTLQKLLSVPNLMISINSDDPAYLQTDILDDYIAAIDIMGVDLANTDLVVKHAAEFASASFKSSWMHPENQSLWRQKVEAAAKGMIAADIKV